MKPLKIPAIVFAACVIFSSCDSFEPESDANIQQTPTRAAITPKIVSYIEVNDTNPLSAGSYIKSDGNPAVDIVILFAANINGPIPASRTETILWNNPNISAILENPTKYVKPLQDKGIKVLYGLLGNHTGLGFANLTDAQVEDFAQKVAAQVLAADLDGVDLDDEWAEYGKNGYPYGSSDSYSKLILRLRELLPDKIITVMDTGYTMDFTDATRAVIDYGYFRYFSPSMFSKNPGMGLPISKWAPIAIDFQNVSNRYAAIIKLNATKAASDGYGAVLTYDLRNDVDHTAILNAIVSGSQELTVTHNGEWFTKDWM